MGLAACSSGVRKILLNYSNVLSYLLQCSGPSKPIRLKLYGSMVLTVLVLTSDEIMYKPFDRPPGEEVVEVIPRDRSRSPSRS